jgi:undecaprenyl-diphosphatase
MVRYRYFLILILLWLAALLSGGPGADWDRHILVWAELDRGGSLALTALVALILWFKGRARNALLLLGIVAGGRLLIDGQKYLFGRGRPDVEGHLVAVHSMSFPSAHAGNSTITYLAIALCVAPLLGTKGRIAAIAAAFILAVAIGLSRVALGVHWPSDVVGGWAFGLAWTLTLARLSGLLRA